MKLILYSRPGCHLCDEMKAVIARVAPDLDVDELDISGDADLEARYGVEIPVLLIDGKKVAKYRLSAAALQTMIAARREAE